MSIQVTIIGLGQIGGSFGLALAEQQQPLERVGHDKVLETAQRAKKEGAVDRVAINLPASVREADLVILALPLDQIRDTLALIAQDLKLGCVVMDTSPVKQAVCLWVKELLPKDRHYIGLTPVINPDYLHTVDTGFQAARKDLFFRGLMGITTPAGTDSQAIKMATDLTILVGAKPFFADIVEMDSLMAATHLLPQVLAAALVDATVSQPGWRESRKIAGRAYANSTLSILNMDAPVSISAAAQLNREHLLRVMDDLLASLNMFRDCILQQEGTDLDTILKRARKKQLEWQVQRTAANWQAEEIAVGVEPPTSREVMGRLIGLGRQPKKKSSK